MPGNGGANAAPAAANNGGEGGGGASSMAWSMFKFLVVYQLLQVFMRGTFSSHKTIVDQDTGTKIPPHMPLWKDGQQFDMYIFLSEEEGPMSGQDLHSEKGLLWHEQDLTFDWDSNNERALNVTLPATAHMQNNGSVYAHAYFVKETYHLTAIDRRKFSKQAVFHGSIRLNEYRPRPKVNVRKNLLSGEFQDERLHEEMTDEEIQDLAQAPEEIISFWRPQLHVRLVHDQTVYPPRGIPAPINSHFHIDDLTQRYFPVVYFDYFWCLQEQHTPLNETVKEVPLELQFSPIGLLKFQMQLQMEESWKRQHAMGSSESDTQEFKRMMLETNPYLLGITMAVSVLHMLFDFLAFKNDIAFWKQRKDMTGISGRTVLVNLISQIIIFLYLLDNETSYMILFSTGIGLVIEIWKIRKALDFVRIPSFPYVTFDDKSSTKYSKTAQHDAQAMTYLGYALYPLVGGYAIYSLYFNEHKSWYSWVLSSLVGTVYTFGFIMMCPQLYINYKLKSVAHLPWRMLTYKALNTFIDDLFAFVIKMPTLHRLSCFRDDIVFFIFLYQRWIYPTDKTRANEFGFVDKEISEKLMLFPEEVRDTLEPELLLRILQFAGEVPVSESPSSDNDSGVTAPPAAEKTEMKKDTHEEDGNAAVSTASGSSLRKRRARKE